MHDKTAGRNPHLWIVSVWGLLLLISIPLPTQTVSSALHASLTVLDATAAIIFLGAILYLAARVLRDSPAASVAEPEKITSREPGRDKALKVFITVTLSFAILTQAVIGLDRAMDYDENDQTVTAILRGGVPPITSYYFGSLNHFVAQATSYASIQTFGKSIRAARFPSILFSILFLAILSWWCVSRLHWFPTLLLFAHLTVNQYVIWYMHSARGYISSMFFTVCLYFLVLEIYENRKQLSIGFAILAVLLSALASLSHNFAALFCLLLAVAILVRGRILKIDTHPVVTWICRIIVVLSLIVCSRLFFVLLRMHRLNFFQYGAHSVWSAGLSFGFVNTLFARIILAIVLLFAIANQTLKPPKLASVFFLTSALVFFSLFLFFGIPTAYSHGRFFLCFLAPFVLWVANEIETTGKSQKQTWIARLLCLSIFVFLPGFYHPEKVSIMFYGDYRFFNTFVRKSTKLMEDSPRPCLFIHSSGIFAQWSTSFYFAGIKHVRERSPECANYFTMNFLEDLEKHPESLNSKHAYLLTQVVRVGELWKLED